jgi:uncharacterized C2H2 Zn-finger protein
LDEFKCAKCGMSFKTQKEIEEHKKGHMKEH